MCYRNEASYSTIMQSMKRIERKIDSLNAKQGPSSQAVAQSPLPVTTPASIRLEHEAMVSSPVSEMHTPGGQNLRPPPPPLSFSAHLTLAWPGVIKLLPDSVFVACADHGIDYVSGIEANRPPLAIIREPTAPSAWIAQLSLRTFRELSYSYFENFNTAHPILDQQVYFQRTLPAAMSNEFSADLDSCVALLVMALGSWDRDVASAEAASTLASSMQREPSYRRDSDLPGLAYFNEARRRMAFFDCDVSLQSCQVFLLAG